MEKVYIVTRSLQLQLLVTLYFELVDEEVLADAGTDIDAVDQEKITTDGAPRPALVTDIDERVKGKVRLTLCYKINCGSISSGRSGTNGLSREISGILHIRHEV